MGDAARRRAALAAFQPLPPDLHVCPACRGRKTRVEPMPAELAMSHLETPVGVCADCGAFWEAYPDDWSHDAVAAEPCDNCAFRPGSPEIRDRDGWRALLAELRAGREFKCHKGAPILLDAGDGAIGFDEAWVRRRGRTCAGFLRALRRWPDWLENRYPGLKAELDAATEAAR